MAELIDTFGRIARDMRVSLTDRCNLRCSYCMPAEESGWLLAGQVLTDAEVGRILQIAVERLGVTKLRFTGGEPLLRPGLAASYSASKVEVERGMVPEGKVLPLYFKVRIPQFSTHNACHQCDWFIEHLRHHIE